MAAERNTSRRAIKPFEVLQLRPFRCFRNPAKVAPIADPLGEELIKRLDQKAAPDPGSIRDRLVDAPPLAGQCQTDQQLRRRERAGFRSFKASPDHGLGDPAHLVQWPPPCAAAVINSR